MSVVSSRLCLGVAKGLIKRSSFIASDSYVARSPVVTLARNLHALSGSQKTGVQKNPPPFPAERRLRLNRFVSERTFFLRTGSSAGPVRMAAPKELSSNKHFGGFNKRYEHESSTIGAPMKFSVYFPPAAEKGKVPVIYWLSGLTCTDENFIQKAGAQRDAAEKGVAIVTCDTSPRGLNVEGESDSWDFGVGAGFYLNATQEKWKAWQMYDYVVKELPELLKKNFPQLDTSNASIFGHSMGGHGALTIFLKNPNKYKTVSAFAPIAHPSKVPWGEKAFTGYLGSDKSKWEEYDATILAERFKGEKDFHILIDQGTDDNFLHQKQLLPEDFAQACEKSGINCKLRMQDGYDHSYYTIATFVLDHITHHAKALKAS